MGKKKHQTRRSKRDDAQTKHFAKQHDAAQNTPKEGPNLVDAARANDVALVQTLCAARVDPDLQDNNGNTPLSLAIRGGHINVVRLLLDHGANPDQRDSNGATPLSLAIDRDNIDVARLLLDRGADFSQLDNNGYIPLYIAALRGNVSMICLLTEYGATFNYEIDGTTLLIRVVESRHIDLAQLLLNHGADVNYADRNNNTALMAAVAIGSADMAKLLLRYGAEVNHQNGDSNTVLMAAVSIGNVVMVQLLLDHGAQYDHGDVRILDIAIHSNCVSVVQLLLERADIVANINQLSSDELTSLHYAALGNNLDIARLLINAGADVTLRDAQGRTPREIAAQYDNQKMVEMMQALEVAQSNEEIPVVDEQQQEDVIVRQLEEVWSQDDAMRDDISEAQQRFQLLMRELISEREQNNAAVSQLEEMRFRENAMRDDISEAQQQFQALENHIEETLQLQFRKVLNDSDELRRARGEGDSLLDIPQALDYLVTLMNGVGAPGNVEHLYDFTGTYS